MMTHSASAASQTRPAHQRQPRFTRARRGIGRAMSGGGHGPTDHAKRCYGGARPDDCIDRDSRAIPRGAKAVAARSGEISVQAIPVLKQRLALVGTHFAGPHPHLKIEIRKAVKHENTQFGPRHAQQITLHKLQIMRGMGEVRHMLPATRRQTIGLS